VTSVDDDLAAAGLPRLPRTAWLAIDLDRLAANFRAIRAALPDGVRVEPVVKADAYGHGSVPVARALQAAGATGLGVATWDEAIELRRAGVEIPILVLYPVPPGLASAAAANGIRLTLGDEALLARTLASWAARMPLGEPPGGILRVEMEIETGLGRGGFSVDALPLAVRAIRAAGDVELVGAWSHLGSPEHARRSHGQAAAFDEAQRVIGAEGALVRTWHLGASGGLLADAARPYDAVRPGLSIYGVLPDDLPVAATRSALAAALEPVMSLRARPVRVTELPVGTGISYGDAFVTARPSRIATLPVGYADGYHRARTNRVHVLVRGEWVPLVGTIAMDAVMADVTDVSPPVTVDDEFVLLGQQGSRTMTAVQLARSGTTISWEVLAGMARRLPRVYYAAARAVGLRTLTDDRGQWRENQDGDGRR
jgi:alanine racemase